MGKEVLVSGLPFKRVLDGSFPVTPTTTKMQPATISRGIEIVAYTSNPEPVYLSHRANLTADEGPDGGFQLIPGASIFVPSLDMADVYFRSATQPCRIAYMGY